MMSLRPDCKRCSRELNGEVDEAGVTACPNCGKRWQLTADRTAIQATILKIHDATHAA